MDMSGAPEDGGGDEEFERRLRALEGWRAETGRRGEEDFHDQRSRAGGVVGGVVAVLLRMMGGG